MRWHYETYNIDVYQNVIHDSEEGFEIDCEDCNKPGTNGSVHDIRIFNNVVYHNIDIQSSGWKGRGMSFFDCCDDGPHPVHDVHVFNNTFVGSQSARHPRRQPRLENLFIRNNIIVNNGGADVQVDRATSVTVENNLLSKAVSNAIGAALTASGNTRGRSVVRERRRQRLPPAERLAGHRQGGGTDVPPSISTARPAPPARPRTWARSNTARRRRHRRRARHGWRAAAGGAAGHRWRASDGGRAWYRWRIGHWGRGGDGRKAGSGGGPGTGGRRGTGGAPGTGGGSWDGWRRGRRGRHGWSA